MPGFDSGTVFATNVDFSGTSQTAGSPTILTNGQMLIGTTALNAGGTHINVGTLTSPSGTITIGYSSPNITIDTVGGSVVTKFAVDVTTGGGTNPVIPTAGGIVTVTGGQYAAGTFGTRVITIDSTAANTFAVQAQISTTSAISLATNNGVSHFNSADFTIDANGFVSVRPLSLNYTNVNHAASPYTVLSTDYYISVDVSAGVVTLNFPNAPTFKQTWIVKDRTGNASTNNITLTTPGATVTFDGVTSYTMTSNFSALNLLANATPTYEIW